MMVKPSPLRYDPGMVKNETKGSTPRTALAACFIGSHSDEARRASIANLTAEIERIRLEYAAKPAPADSTQAAIDWARARPQRKGTK